VRQQKFLNRCKPVPPLRTTGAALSYNTGRNFAFLQGVTGTSTRRGAAGGLWTLSQLLDDYYAEAGDFNVKMDSRRLGATTRLGRDTRTRVKGEWSGYRQKVPVSSTSFPNAQVYTICVFGGEVLGSCTSKLSDTLTQRSGMLSKTGLFYWRENSWCTCSSPKMLSLVFPTPMHMYLLWLVVVDRVMHVGVSTWFAKRGLYVRTEARGSNAPGAPGRAGHARAWRRVPRDYGHPHACRGQGMLLPACLGAAWYGYSRRG
jgi:hypothetical protein